jgi:hypothetical protein
MRQERDGSSEFGCGFRTDHAPAPPCHHGPPRHLLPFDYYTDRPQPATGLAQAATLIRALRAEAGPESTLLLDNGDMLSGSLLSDLLAARSRLLAPSARGATGFIP